MAGWWFHHKTRTEKASKFGITGAPATRSVYVAPRPTRHFPNECRPAAACGERRGSRISVRRRHLLSRPTAGLRRKPQSIVAQLLPSISVIGKDNPVSAFERVTDGMPIAANENFIGVSEVRRVYIEDTGVVALERTRCTKRYGGSRVVTLLWAVYVAPEKIIRMASICAEGDVELRTYRTQVADFLRRWTASAGITPGRSLTLR